MADERVAHKGDGVRQGETGHHVRYVLAVGLLGVIFAFVLVAVAG